MLTEEFIDTRLGAMGNPWFVVSRAEC